MIILIMKNIKNLNLKIKYFKIFKKIKAKFKHELRNVSNF